MLEEVAQRMAAGVEGHGNFKEGIESSLVASDATITQYAASVGSSVNSQDYFDDPSQTVLLLDWDDTLFPTSHVFDRWGCKSVLGPGECDAFSEDALKKLRKWAEAVEDFLKQACTLSGHCVIVTNSQRPWVDSCIDRFAPQLRPLFNSPTGPKVVYASERLRRNKLMHTSDIMLRPVKNTFVARKLSQEEIEGKLTAAKFCAMQDEVTRFYSRYPGQTWKNILSIGDMRYERDALVDLVFRRVPASPRERVRAKSLLLPTDPTVTELTLHLKFSRLLLPAYVLYDGDFELDLQSAFDPLEAIGTAVGLPELTTVPFSRHAWGRQSTPLDDDVMNSLCDVAVTVHNALLE